MCGITGIIYSDRKRPIDPELLHGMADQIAHRGPDAYGEYRQPGIGLAHLRLSIIDLQSGNQPIGNEDGSIQVIFNGEIYNYQSLRQELIERGHQFRTNSDTEVLVHLYEEHGPDFVKHLRGMFAFALWDSKQQRLLLSRDRVGQKPLYFYQDSEKILFASELKAILHYPGVSRELDLEALEDYLTFGVIPSPRSIFQAIHKLNPATSMLIDGSRWTSETSTYWQLDQSQKLDLPVEEWTKVVREKFIESVNLHRVSDVPVGSFLSGGLDSSAVTAALAESSSEPVTTFSIGFQEKKFSELEYARQISERYGTNHVEEVVTPEAVSSLQEMVKFYDEPFADASAIPTMHVSRIASQHVKVVLSGDGGDEAFGGYSRYAHDLKEASLRRFIPLNARKYFLAHVARVWPKTDWLPRYLRGKTFLTNLSLLDGQAYANTISIFRQPLRQRLLNPSLQAELKGYSPETQIWRGYGVPGRDVLSGMISADIAMLLPDDYLTKVDRASMAYGLEVRPPLVDHEFLELASTIPSSMKINRGQTKWIFKQVCSGWLPDEIVHRPKQGFEIPIDQWLRGPLRELFESIVLSDDSPLAGYLSIEVIRELYQRHLQKIGRHGQMLWSLLILGVWMEHYLYSSHRLSGQTLSASHLDLVTR